jgi:protein-S-isoprenylcysteine O-methyltransferase Ste14
MPFLRTVAWLACVIYSTIPCFWLMIHPQADRWRARVRSPFRLLIPAWITMWIGLGALTGPWRHISLYSTPWTWIPPVLLFACGIFLYVSGGAHFSWSQLGGLPEVRPNHTNDRLVTTGIRAHVRHPVYLAHLCEMLAWSTGTGLLVCWILTAFAILTGAMMICMEDAELERRFGEAFTRYRASVGAIIPRLQKRPNSPLSV